MMIEDLNAAVQLSLQAMVWANSFNHGPISLHIGIATLSQIIMTLFVLIRLSSDLTRVLTSYSGDVEVIRDIILRLFLQCFLFDLNLLLLRLSFLSIKTDPELTKKSFKVVNVTNFTPDVVLEVYHLFYFLLASSIDWPVGIKALVRRASSQCRLLALRLGVIVAYTWLETTGAPAVPHGVLHSTTCHHLANCGFYNLPIISLTLLHSIIQTLLLVIQLCHGEELTLLHYLINFF